MVHHLPWNIDGYLLADQEIPSFYGAWKFITVFTKAYHWTPPWCKFTAVHTLTNLFLLRSILIMSSYVCLYLPIKILYANLVSTANPFHPSWFNHHNNIRYTEQKMKLICHFLHSPLICKAFTSSQYMLLTFHIKNCLQVLFTVV